MKARWPKLIRLVALISAVLVVVGGAAFSASGAASGPPGGPPDPEDGYPCREISTSTSLDGNSVSTWLVFCWTGTSVYSVTPTGGSTTASSASNWILNDWDQWSYCCVGQSAWHMYKIADFALWEPAGPPWLNDCLRNELHLYGNGTYSSNPGHWQKFSYSYSDPGVDCTS
jgi:hypothetical protein